MQPNYHNNVLRCTSMSSATTGGTGGEEKGEQHPNEQDLNRAFQKLSEHIPNLFVHPMDYSIFHPQVITENNINGKRTE